MTSNSAARGATTGSQIRRVPPMPCTSSSGGPVPLTSAPSSGSFELLGLGEGGGRGGVAAPARLGPQQLHVADAPFPEAGPAEGEGKGPPAPEGPVGDHRRGA